jgi:C-terminal processing protease CtpA/Prc
MRKLTQPLSMVRLGPIVNAKKLMLGGGLMSKQMRSMDVTLVRRTPDETLGLGIGYDGPNSTFLLSIKPGSPAERCGALKLSDEIIAVNGTKLSPKLDFHELLASAGMFVTLTILRAEGASPGAKSGAAVEAAAMREIQVTLVKRNPQESLGLGVGFNASGATVLASMKPGSPAERCAALQLNDQIVAVGGQPISADTDFKTLLASTPIANLKVTLTILRSAKSSGFVDDGGTINVQGSDINISPDGSLRANGQTLGRIQVVRFEDASPLERVAGARFKLPVGAPQPTPVAVALEPQALEMSNVSAITGMVDLIATNRAFEAYTKAAQTIDQLNQTAINKTNS